MQNYVLPALAMYFRENQKKGFRRFLSSVPVQLCRQSDPYSGILSDLHSEHDDGFDGFDDPGDPLFEALAGTPKTSSNIPCGECLG